MGPQLNSLPPAILERIVRGLVPPAAREHVLGDLSERYVSPARYLADALRLLPFVVGTQLRRNCNFAVLGIVAFTAYGVFGSRGVSHWLVAAIPTFLMIATLALRDAYRAGEQNLVRESAIDVGLGAFLVLLWQAIAGFVAPDFLLPRRLLVVMLPLLCVVTFFVRTQRAGQAGPWPPPLAGAMSRAELEQEVRSAETTWRRAVRIEIGAAVIVAAFAVLLTLGAKEELARIAGLLACAGGLFIAWFLYTRMRPVSMPSGLTFADAVSHYRDTLEKRSGVARTFMWWYALPLAPAPILIAIGGALHAPEPMPVLLRAALCIGLVGVLLYVMNAGARKKLQQRIAQLGELKEKP